MSLRDEIAEIVIEGERNKEYAGEIADKILELPEIKKSQKTGIFVGGVEQPPKIICEWMKQIVRQSGGMRLDGKDVEVSDD